MSEVLAERLEILVLARLSVAGKSPSPASLSAALFPFVSAQLTPAEWRQRCSSTLRSLREQGLVDDKVLFLTVDGWQRLQALLGLKSRPSAKTWRAFTIKYLPQLLGLRFAGGSNADLGLLVLSERLRVPSDAARTPAKLVNTWLRDAYGLRSSKVTLEALRAALLARELGVPGKSDLDRVIRIGAAKLTGAPKGNQQALIGALTTRWLGGAESTREARAVSGTTDGGAGVSRELVRKVKSAAQRADVRRFGPDKAFIGSVWDALREDPDVSSLGEGGFKRMLVDAHRTGALVLARADLVAAMNPEDVAASETHHLNATYHFIQL